MRANKQGADTLCIAATDGGAVHSDAQRSSFRCPPS
ncbi:hypothetical protein GGI1_23476, partial [Acidithiobacillus sp. GGI-221]